MSRRFGAARAEKSAQNSRESPICRQSPGNCPCVTPLLSYKSVVETPPPRWSGSPLAGTEISTGTRLDLVAARTQMTPWYIPAWVPEGTLKATLKEAVLPAGTRSDVTLGVAQAQSALP